MLEVVAKICNSKKTPCYNPFIKLSITRQSKITSWAGGSKNKMCFFFITKTLLIKKNKAYMNEH